MVDALMLVVTAVGLLIILSMPAFVWAMVFSGLIQIMQQKKEQENSAR